MRVDTNKTKASILVVLLLHLTDGLLLVRLAHLAGRLVGHHGGRDDPDTAIVDSERDLMVLVHVPIELKLAIDELLVED